MQEAIRDKRIFRNFARDNDKRQTSQGVCPPVSLSPIEVKSGTNYTLTSINKCIKKFGQYLSTPYVLHTKDVEIKDELVYLPLYMTPLL